METNSLNSLSQERLTPAQAYNIGDVIAYKVKSNYTSYCELIDEQTELEIEEDFRLYEELAAQKR